MLPAALEYQAVDAIRALRERIGDVSSHLDDLRCAIQALLDDEDALAEVAADPANTTPSLPSSARRSGSRSGSPLGQPSHPSTEALPSWQLDSGAVEGEQHAPVGFDTVPLGDMLETADQCRHSIGHFRLCSCLSALLSR